MRAQACREADDREPGQRLGTKEDLRKRSGVAVATVNEAMRLLETRGLIEARPGPGGGVFVARPAARIAMAHATADLTRPRGRNERMRRLRGRVGA